MIDPKKLMAYMKSGIGHILKPILPEELEESDVEEIEEAMENPSSDEAQTLRKCNGGYIEMDESVGPLSCGNCIYLIQNGFCSEELIRAQVNGENGTCRYFSIKDKSKQVFPPTEESLESQSFDETAEAEEE